MCGKKSLLFFLVLLAFLLPCFSQTDPAKMTDAQIIAELMDNLTVRENSIKKQEAQLANDKEDLTLDQKALENDKKLFEQRKQLLSETAIYWQNYKKDTLKDKLIFAGIGFVGGFALGGYSGLRLGVTITLR